MDPKHRLAELWEHLEKRANLRAEANSAWRVGGTPPGPKTSPVGKTKVPSTPTAKPPSNRSYHADILQSLYNPSRGPRNS